MVIEMPSHNATRPLPLTRRPLFRLSILIACALALLFVLLRDTKSPAKIALDRPTGELLLVQAVFRHGARTPLAELYFADTEWKNCGEFEGVNLVLRDENGGKNSPPILDQNAPLLPGGCRMGELTQNGYGMAQDFGAWLRSRYTQEMEFLSPSFKAEEVMLRTTCIKRTVATLKGVMTGLFPDAARAGAPQISVNASKEISEIEYGKNRTCPALGPQLDLLQAMVAARDAKDATVAAQAANVAKRLHLPSASLSWIRLHDVLAAMKAEEIPLPKGADLKLTEEISDMAIAREGAVIAPTPEQKFLPTDKCQQVVRRSIGPLIQRFVSNMQQAGYSHKLQQQQQQQRQSAVNGSNNDRGILEQRAKEANCSDDVRGGGRALRQHQTLWHSRQRSVLGEGDSSRSGGGAAGPKKLFLFSGHDSTITPVMAALGAPLHNWPPFVASVVFELWGSKATPGNTMQSVDDLEVRVLYDRKPLALKHSRGREGGWIRLGDLRTQLAPFSADSLSHQAECKAR